LKLTNDTSVLTVTVYRPTVSPEHVWQLLLETFRYRITDNLRFIFSPYLSDFNHYSAPHQSDL